MPKVVETFICGTHGESEGRDCSQAASGECSSPFEVQMPVSPEAHAWANECARLIASGEQRERAAIVAWLRTSPKQTHFGDWTTLGGWTPAGTCRQTVPMDAAELANAIEKGEHL